MKRMVEDMGGRLEGRQAEVKRSEVEVWRGGEGPGEQAESGRRERRRPAEVTTHTPVTQLNARSSKVQDEGMRQYGGTSPLLSFTMLINTHPSP